MNIEKRMTEIKQNIISVLENTPSNKRVEKLFELESEAARIAMTPRVLKNLKKSVSYFPDFSLALENSRFFGILNAREKLKNFCTLSGISGTEICVNRLNTPNNLGYIRMPKTVQTGYIFAVMLKANIDAVLSLGARFCEGDYRQLIPINKFKLTIENLTETSVSVVYDLSAQSLTNIKYNKAAARRATNFKLQLSAALTQMGIVSTFSESKNSEKVYFHINLKAFTSSDVLTPILEKPQTNFVVLARESIDQILKELHSSEDTIKVAINEKQKELDTLCSRLDEIQLRTATIAQARKVI